MANRGLGTLTLDLIARIGGFEQGMDKAARHADKRLREIERRAQQFGHFLGVTIAAGASAAVVGMAALTKHAIDQADAMRDLSIRVGISTETLSAYSYAAAQTGTDVESLARGMKALAKNAADALNPTSEQAKVFGALGISVADSTGRLRSLAELVPEIADRFHALEDGTTKAALAQALFGKSGVDLTEFLNAGAAGLDAFTKRAAELGLTLDSQTAAAADEFKDTLGDVKAQASGLGLAIARELLPDLKNAARDLGELATQGNLAHNVATVLGATFHVGAGVLSAYDKAVRLTTLALENYMTVASSVLEIQKNLSTFGFADGSVSGAMDRIRQQKAASDREMAAIMAGRSGTRPGLVFAGEGAEPAGLFKQAARLRSDVGNMEAAIASALSNANSIATRTATVQAHTQALEEALSLEEQWAILEEQVYTPAAIDAHNARVDAWAKEALAVSETTDKMSVFAEQAGRNIQDTFADYLFDPFQNGLKGMLQSFGDTLRRMVAEMAASKIFDAIGGFASAQGGGGFWGTVASMFTKNAKGGVYSSPDLSAYSGGIYSSPKVFKFASGAGIFGEAGPEAIMPLQRAPNGKLGVQAIGASGLNVEVNNYGGEQVKPRLAPDASGLLRKLVIDIGAEDIAIGGKMAAAGKARFGWRDLV